MRGSAQIFVAAVVGLVLVGCGKNTASTADSAGVATTFDADAARATIIAADSAWLRALRAKNVDSLMPYYVADALSVNEGKAVKGTRDIRTAYGDFVKGNPRDISLKIDAVNFSDDGTMGWEHGSFAGTVDGPGGKPTRFAATYVNVWKNVDGKWLLVAEISSPTAPTT